MMSQEFHNAGIHLAANIKPCLLQDHPRYNEVAEQELFIRDSEYNVPERSASGMMRVLIWTLRTHKQSHGGRKV